MKLTEIMEAKLGANLIANRIERQLRRSKSYTNIKLVKRLYGQEVFEAVEFDFGGERFRVEVKQLKKLG